MASKSHDEFQSNNDLDMMVMLMPRMIGFDILVHDTVIEGHRRGPFAKEGRRVLAFQNGKLLRKNANYVFQIFKRSNIIKVVNGDLT